MLFHSRLHVNPFQLALKVLLKQEVLPKTTAVNHVVSTLI